MHLNTGLKESIKKFKPLNFVFITTVNDSLIYSLRVGSNICIFLYLFPLPMGIRSLSSTLSRKFSNSFKSVFCSIMMKCECSEFNSKASLLMPDFFSEMMESCWWKKETTMIVTVLFNFKRKCWYNLVICAKRLKSNTGGLQALMVTWVPKTLDWFLRGSYFHNRGVNPLIQGLCISQFC